MSNKKIFKKANRSGYMKRGGCGLDIKEDRKILKKYQGEWIALENTEIIAYGNSLKRVLSNAKKKTKTPLIIKVPKAKEVLLA